MLGSLLDPLADKLLVMGLVGALAWQSRIPLFLVILVGAFCTSMPLTALRMAHLRTPCSASRC